MEALSVRLRAAGAAPIVEMGFLNYSQPLFAEAFARCVQQGATEITVVPYFLVAGKFVMVDLPREIEAQRALHPQIAVHFADAMRFHEGLADAIVSSASRAREPREWRDILKLAPEWCRVDVACPLFGTPRCPASQPLTAEALA